MLAVSFNSLAYLSIFVSDCHRGIAKWIRETCTDTTHYFDIWHVARSVSKKLLGANKVKGYEQIKDWKKAYADICTAVQHQPKQASKLL